MTISETREVTDSVVSLDHRLRAVCGRIPPLWPLESFVAVNPYVGLSDRAFDEAAELLASVAGARATLPTRFYLDAVDAGRIEEDDLAQALAARAGADGDAAALLARARAFGDETAAWAPRVPTVATVAASTTGHDWPRLANDRISAWAAAYFDEGQALWRSASRGTPLFRSWREEASIDRTPEIMGLRGFRRTVRSLPDDPLAAAAAALDRLAVPDEVWDVYVHALLLRVGGWAAYARRVVFERELAGDDDDTLVQLSAVLLAWELAMLEALSHRGLADAWADAREQLLALGSRPVVRRAVADRLVLQDAFDRSEQRRLVAQLGRPAPRRVAGSRPAVQAVFCIDVRSEVMRRNLEAVAPEAETIGFAGFFGFPVELVPLGHEQGQAQCPVLLRPGHTVGEALPDPARTELAVEHRRLRHHVRRAWKSFKLGAVSCFGFVSPVGLVYLPKLVSDGLGTTRPVKRPEDEALPRWAVDGKGPRLAPSPTSSQAAGIPFDDRVALAEKALRGMSLTDGYAPLVLITGHGASTVNNPYENGLACGACGGHTGEANARVAVAILNDPDVRVALAERGIVIPADTWFVAAQHNTTTDDVVLFDRGDVPDTHREAVARLEEQLARAAHQARAERAGRLGIGAHEDVDRAVHRRSTDWAQVRPEWGLAGCRAFVAAPRARTRGLDLEGRSFLHSYDWRQDDGFGVLELIMTAPVVVASWISLQYYASTVDNESFGSGNKTLHNVVGRVGVLEGSGGDLRTGLPWQSVHDGERYQHEPIRLNVVIEAPLDAMNDVLARHDHVRDLCDNGWLHLLAMDESGRVAHRYAGDLRWECV